MTLKIIGPGFGRTGTKSTKDALEMLGFGPCHHMHEVLANPDQVAYWQEIAAGRPVDYNAVFAGYSSQIDWPGAHIWRELAAFFPDAKVLLTMRPEESWYRSYSKTIGKLSRVYRTLPLPPHITDMMDAINGLLERETFQGPPYDKNVALAAYRQRLEDVKAAIPRERLLVFDVAEGWGPLCDFLEVPVPDKPFPHHNLREDFWEVLGGEPPDPT
jgi:hypothetical protein